MENTKKELQNIVSSCSIIKAKALTAYDKNKALAYAWKWSKTGEMRRAPWYASFGLDCTNFGSQVIQAGGYKDDSVWHSRPVSATPASAKIAANYFISKGGWTNPNGTGTYVNPYGLYVSPAFRGVDQFKNWSHSLTGTSDYFFWNNTKSNGVTYKQSSGAPYTSLWENMFRNNVGIGDVIWADFENNGAWDHTMVISGYYTDSTNGKSYPTLTYHTTDYNDTGWDKFYERLWNQGYRNPNFVTNKFNTLN